MPYYRFTCIYKTPLWSGRDIVSLKRLGKHEDIGESWEISPLPDNESCVIDGPHAGKPIHCLIEELREKLVGRNNYARFGTNFPLLIKFLSTSADLSIQVHPDNSMAQEVEGQTNGKSECWYVVKTGKDANLYCGFNRRLDLAAYDRIIAEGKLPEVLQRYDTHPGDAFFIPAGQIHCIGAHNLLIEIQQPSDTTYRVHDFNRRDARGKLRELHTEKARRALCFDHVPCHHTHYDPPHNKRIPLEHHPEFITALYHIDVHFRIDYSQLDSFVVLVAFEGEATLTNDTGERTSLRAGETLLLPATTQYVDISTMAKTFSCIETYVDSSEA